MKKHSDIYWDFLYVLIFPKYNRPTQALRYSVANRTIERLACIGFILIFVLGINHYPRIRYIHTDLIQFKKSFLKRYDMTLTPSAIN